MFKTANNLPSVFVRDSFFDAMTSSTESLSSSSRDNASSITGGSLGAMIVANRDESQTPVATARLRRGDGDGSNPSSSYYIMDAMRCSIRKKDTNLDCDGGSEHSEALGVCIDEIVLTYLRG